VHRVTSKQNRLKFGTSTTKRKCILDLIHYDVWQASVVSLGGARYFVSFIDDFSKRCWVYPIKRKADVLAVFKTFKVWVELKFEKKIKCLRIDNGEEYTRLPVMNLITSVNMKVSKGSSQRHTLHNKMEQQSG